MKSKAPGAPNQTGRAVMFYPFFFAAGYLVTKDIPFLDMLWLFLGLVLLEAIVFGGVYHLTGKTHRSGFVTVLSMVWLLYFGTAVAYLKSVIPGLSRLMTDSGWVYYLLLLFPWTAVFLMLGSGYVWQRFGTGRSLTAYLNLVTGAVLLFFCSGVVRLETHEFYGPVGPLTSSTTQAVPGTARPDIYYIVLDSYLRADVLDQARGYDNSDFVDFLSSRGFYVAAQSRSNYMFTAPSLSSSLNMSYLRSAPSVPQLRRESLPRKLISDSQVRTLLEKAGYRFVSFATPYYFTDITDADVFLSLGPDKARWIFLESQLLPSSIGVIPLAAGLISPGSETYRDCQERILYIFDQLGKMPALPGPKFVFAHIIAPHFPFVFDQNGPVTPDIFATQGIPTDPELMRTAYIGQVEYINRLVERMVDILIKDSVSPPIIIIQGDHGDQLNFDTESKDATCLYERSAILNAYYLPGLEANPLYESITPVNSFRVIFNQYFGAQFDILEDKVYYSTGSEYYKFINVTESSEQPCPNP